VAVIEYPIDITPLVADVAPPVPAATALELKRWRLESGRPIEALEGRPHHDGLDPLIASARAELETRPVNQARSS